MYILAVDPGVETGIALLNPEGEVVWTMTSRAPYEELKSALSQYCKPPYTTVSNDEYGKETSQAELAAEVAPSTRHYQDVHSMVSDCFAGLQVHWIRPSEWKSHPFCKVTVSDYDTKHEAEAIGIGRAYLLRRNREQTDSAGAGTDREHQKSSGHLGDGAGSVSDLSS